MRRKMVIALCAAGVAAVGGYLGAPMAKTEWQAYQGARAFETGAFDDAIASLQPAVQNLESSSPERATRLRRLLAQSQLALDRVEDAVGQYQLLLGDDGGNALPQLVLGLHAWREGKIEAGSAYFKQGLEKGDCEPCEAASAELLAARQASVARELAHLQTQRAFTQIGAQTQCLAVVAAKMGVGMAIPALHPKLMKFAQAIEITSTALRRLEVQLKRLLDQFAFVSSIGMGCPSHARTVQPEGVGIARSWADWLPLSVGSGFQATGHLYTLGMSAHSYFAAGGLRDEHDTRLAAAEKWRETAWNHLKSAASKPQFAKAGLSSLKLPDRPAEPKGRSRSIWERLKIWRPW